MTLKLALSLIAIWGLFMAAVLALFNNGPDSDENPAERPDAVNGHSIPE